jgi:hypothetical protein
MAKISRDIDRQTGHRPSWVYAAEPNPAGTGNHVHGYTHDPLTTEQLTGYSLAHEGGWAQVQPVPRNAPARYFGYPMGTMRLDEYPTRAQAVQAVQAYQALNGAHLAYPTRRCYRDGHGVRITQGEATRQATKRYMAWCRQGHEGQPATSLPRRPNRPKLRAAPTRTEPETMLHHPISRVAFN